MQRVISREPGKNSRKLLKQMVVNQLKMTSSTDDDLVRENHRLTVREPAE